MKKFLLSTLLIFSLILFAGGNVQADNIFEITVPDAIGTGRSLQSAALGFDMGNIRISGTVDSAFLSIDSEISQSYDNETRSSSQNYSGRVIIPGGEVKFFLGNNKVRPYLLGGIFKSLSGVEISSSISNQNISNIDTQQTEEIEKLVEEALNFWGTKFAFGTEYKINENIGLSAETGMHMFFDSVEIENKQRNEYEEIIAKTRNELSAKLGATYTTISLNFYF